MVVVHPIRNSIGDETLTDDEIVQRAMEKIPLTALSPQIVAPEVIPVDRSKREAWRQSGAIIVLDPEISSRIDADLSRVVTDEAERETCKKDAPIMSLINQTRQQWRDWVAANFPSLTTVGERNKLGDLFWVVSIGVRRVLRQS